jgi:hypothetical protein
MIYRRCTVKKLLSETLAALWQGLAILLILSVLFCVVYAAIYWFSWGSNPHWLDAFRDRFKLWNLPDNRFWSWIHQDTQYWVVRVRFDKGPIVIEGPVPDARYWSIAYYPARENTFSIDTQSVVLDDRGRYRIIIGRDVENSLQQQAIKVDPDVTRGIVELRVTLPDVREPLTLPSITQDGRPLIEEGQP